MNKARRKAIGAALALLESVKSDVETIMYEEQDYFDNMPESLQGGEKGDMAQGAIDALQSCLEGLETAIDGLDQARA